MKRFLTLVGLAALVAAIVLPIPSVAAAQVLSPATYTVQVGLENAQQGVEVMAFFPNTVIIHAGDIVHWKINTKEIHTVSFGYAPGSALPDFLIGAPGPGPSPLIVNPVAADVMVPPGGAYTGGMANSGIMGFEDGEYRDFVLSFPDPGTYVYVCLVHGWLMSGTVVVEPAFARVPSPQQAAAQGRQEMAKALAQVPAVMQAAMKSVTAPVDNGDGTMTYHVMLGYGEGQISLVRFFPDKIEVRPGDTVVWEMTPFSDAPHTVTFLNGEPAPGLFIYQAPYYYIDPGTLFPYQPGPELTRSGVYNSGVILPIPGSSYSLTIGDMTPGPQPYLCLLHDESGMKGTLVILPR
jgi:plastocyanin